MGAAEQAADQERDGNKDAASTSTTRSAPTSSKGCLCTSQGKKRRRRGSRQGGPSAVHTEGKSIEEDCDE